MRQYVTHIEKILQCLAVSHTVPARSQEITVAFNFISECTVLLKRYISDIQNLYLDEIIGGGKVLLEHKNEGYNDALQYSWLISDVKAKLKNGHFGDCSVSFIRVHVETKPYVTDAYINIEVQPCIVSFLLAGTANGEWNRI
jgi:hypothetical protein